MKTNLLRRGNEPMGLTRLFVFIALIAFFAFFVIAPIVSMLCRMTPDGMRSVFESPQFWPAVRNSLLTALVATVVSILLAFGAAWALARTHMRGREFFGLLFIVPMLIPSISHAFGLVALFGSNGLFTNLLHLKGNIYGFWGIVAGSVMYSFPVAFLMFQSILQYEDSSPYKAAGILGINRFHQFIGITLPYVKKTLISAFFAVFTMIITDYGVPLMIGGKTLTLSVLMYNKAAAGIDFDGGSVVGALLLIPAIVAFLVDFFNPEKGNASFVPEKIEIQKRPLGDTLAFLFCVLLSLFILSPIVSFVFMAFETKYPVDPTFTWNHVIKTFNKGAGTYLLNSVLYSLLAAVFGTALAFGASYVTARIRTRFTGFLHLICMTSMAIPGIVLGLSYLIFFHDSPVYGTVMIVALVNSVHFFASPYLMMYNTLSKVNPNLEAVGASLGIRRWRIIRDVIIPKVRFSLYEMLTYFFVNSMMTISAISFLAPPAPKSVALMINQFEAQRLMESAAFVSILILLVNLILQIVIRIIKKKQAKAV